VTKPKTGRPSAYTQELADSICARLAEGMSLRTICKADDMPDASTVFRWLRTKPGFCEQYTRAKEESAEALSEDMLEIADDKEGDPQRDRLRIETRKWLASKLKPKKYGDKLAVGGADDMPPLKAVTRIELVSLGGQK
jgi:hypothetical protein